MQIKHNLKECRKFAKEGSMHQLGAFQVSPSGASVGLNYVKSSSSINYNVFE
jgi:hypothetical protein